MQDFQRVSDHLKKLCDKGFKDFIVQYQIKFLKIVSDIFDFNWLVFKPSFKKWGRSYYPCVFISKAIPVT